MFNRNGSNNGNGSANGVHKDTAPVSSTGQAVVARNGNGHKPDAPIVSEHDLLWDGLSPAVTQALGQPLEPALVSQRKGRGVQFGNGFYGDQPQVGNPSQPQRVPAQSLPRTGYGANGNSGQAQSDGNPGRNQANDRAEAQAEKLRARLIEIAAEQGLDEDQVRSAVVDRTGKGIDDLTAAEIGPLVEAAANKLRQMQQAQAA